MDGRASVGGASFVGQASNCVERRLILHVPGPVVIEGRRRDALTRPSNSCRWSHTEEPRRALSGRSGERTGRIAVQSLETTARLGLRDSCVQKQFKQFANVRHLQALATPLRGSALRRGLP